MTNWDPARLVREQTGRLVLFVVVFLSSVVAILATKQTLFVAGIWVANGIAVVALMRMPRRKQRFSQAAVWIVVVAAIFLANIVVGNTFADSIVFTVGNATEIFVAYAILRFRRFPAWLGRDETSLVRLLRVLPVAAILAPAAGATVGALLLSARDETSFVTLWTQWWEPSALGLVLIAPAGLMISDRWIGGFRDKPLVRDLVILLAGSATVVLVVLATHSLDGAMLAAPFVLWAGVRYQALGVTVAILLTLVPLLPMAASTFGETISLLTTPVGRLTRIQNFAILVGLLGLWLASVFVERDALAKALDQSRRQAVDLAEARLRLLTSVAHEIRTPLSVIQGSSELISASPGTHERNERLIAGIRESATSLGALAQDLLNRARRERAEIGVTPEWFDPAPVIAGVVRSQEMLGPTELRLDISIRCEGRMWADPRRFQQVATNLITNAVKYGGEYGPILVSVRRVREGVALRVSNGGPGIPPGLEHEVFQPFALTSGPATQHSAGAGLALTKHLVEAHGGTIRCTSTPFLETTFEAVFPLPDVEAEPPQNPTH